MHSRRSGEGEAVARAAPAPPSRQSDADPDIEEYRPLSRRRQVVVGLLGVGMAVFVMWQVMRAPRDIPPHLMPIFLGKPVAPASGEAQAPAGSSAAAPSRPEPAPCAPGQTSACLGGKAAVFVLPPAAGAASAVVPPR